MFPLLVYIPIKFGGGQLNDNREWLMQMAVLQSTNNNFKTADQTLKCVDIISCTRSCQIIQQCLPGDSKRMSDSCWEASQVPTSLVIYCVKTV